MSNLAEARKKMTQPVTINLPGAKTIQPIGKIDPYQESYIIPYGKGDIRTKTSSIYQTPAGTDETKTSLLSKAPVTTGGESDYAQFLPKPFVAPEKKWYENPFVKAASSLFLPEPVKKLFGGVKAATTTSDILANTGLTKTNVARDFMENLKGTFTSMFDDKKTTGIKDDIFEPKGGDGKTGIETIARGDGRQIEKPTVQEAISKGEGLESGKKLLGLSDEETNYFKKLFASRDRKFLQSIFDKGTIRIQSGKVTQKEKDVYNLLQQYLVDPKEGIMGVA